MLKKALLCTAITATLAGAAGLANAAPRSVDPYTDGARVTAPRDVYSDGARITGPRDVYTDGARMGTRDVYTDGARVRSPRDSFTDGA
ncbi:copper resistance protein CopQ [Cupriavidus agavae]|uniref:Copper resistance protein CopQ n=1 Tax=Cupriavidus agavae TaxID=1001822 RepID=A0A4Q7RE05_9BURK|nr:copper resistance protein CopQ [Cupriavidus agavae]RZT31396.1 hypothetical protein EV147_4577 [Cupriavidus agavae]